MKIVVATVDDQCNIDLAEVEYNGELKQLAEILDIKEYEKKYQQFGCPGISMDISENYSAILDCEYYEYPVGFSFGKYTFNYPCKIAFYGTENFMNQKPGLTKEYILDNIKFKEHGVN